MLLCENEEYKSLQAQVDELALEEFVSPLLDLAGTPHNLNYIPFRLLLLFTITTKAVSLISELGVVPVVMHVLNRPQESECLRYCVELLSRIARSALVLSLPALSDISHLDPVTLINLTAGYYTDQVPQARLQILQVLSVMLVKRKGRQALLRAGATYAILDLIGQHKRGLFFSKAEVSLLEQLRKELLHWENHTNTKNPTDPPA